MEHHAPPAPKEILEMVAANSALQGAHVILRELIQQGLNSSITQPTIREVASKALSEMVQGTGPSFAILQGARPPAVPSSLRGPVPALHRCGAPACCCAAVLLCGLRRRPREDASGSSTVEWWEPTMSAASSALLRQTPAPPCQPQLPCAPTSPLRRTACGQARRWSRSRL